jgi:hypothetical protein
MKNSLIVIIALPLFIVACTKSGRVKDDKPAMYDSVSGFVLADTIIYDVNIVNRNLDDQWATQRLGRLNKKLMIDNIYDLIYSGNASAYNHTTGEKLTLRQLQDLELTDEFNREKVDMIQFKEIWYMNPDQKTFTKEVISMVLGTQVYGSDGQYLANRAVIRVELNAD